MPHAETDVDRRIDDLESTSYERQFVGPDGRALVDILPTNLELESVTPSPGGSFVILSWMGWQPEVETFEIWLEKPDEPAEKIGEFETSPATLTISVEVETPVVLTVRARAGDRTVGFAQSPSVAAVIPAPVSGGDPGPMSIGESHLIHVGTNRIVIKDADILNLNANKINAGQIDAGLINVININADNINAGSLSASRLMGGMIDGESINIINVNASEITSGFLTANRIRGGVIDANIIDVINLNADSIVAGTLNAAIVNALEIDAAQITTGLLSAARFVLSDRVHILVDVPPANDVGVDGNVAVGIITGEVWDKDNGVWDEREVDLPAISGLHALASVTNLNPSDIFDISYDLYVSWDAGAHAVEVEIGDIPSVDLDNLAGATWDSLSGVSLRSFYSFNSVHQHAPTSAAVRARFLGVLDQKGPWSYAFFSVDPVTPVAPVINSFAPDSTTIQVGESTLLRWTIIGATGVSINQGIGSVTPVSIGSVSVSPTITTEYTLTAINSNGNVVATTTVTVVPVTTLAQPSIPSFTADDTTLTPTQSTTLRWTGVNGVSGTIVGTGVNRVLTASELAAGSQIIGPLSVGSHSYELTLVGEDGTDDATSSVTVNVSSTPTPDPDPDVTIDSFTVDDSEIASGESTVLRWQTSHANSVTLNGATVNADGTMTVSPTGDIVYTLRATGEGGPISATVSVEVEPVPDDPEVVSFSASSTSISSGGSVTVSWVTRNGDTRNLVRQLVGGSPIAINVSASGSRTYTLTETTLFQIQVWNASDPAGTVDQRFITVTVTVAAAVIDSFSVDDSTPNTGDEFTLSWQTTGATHVRLRRTSLGGYFDLGGNRPADGSHTITAPSGTRSYRIRAYNSAGDYVESSTITVDPN